MLARLAAALVALLPCAAAAQGLPPALTLFSFGTGDLTGSYYASARAICDRLNRNPELAHLRCSPEPTQGSIYNLAMLDRGELDIVIAQSDWQRAAWLGEGRFAEAGAQSDLRSVMSLYPETITVLAATGSGVTTAADLVGKRVDIGLPTSGRHATVVELMRRLGISRGDAGEWLELGPDVSVAQLCDGRIDAAIFVLGHPSPLIADAIERCGARLVPFDGPRIREVLGAAEDFEASEIPAATYLGQTRAVAGWSVYATLVTRADISPRVVAAVVETVLANRDWLGRHVPVLRDLDPGAMPSRALTAPLHPAAERAFAETGG